MPFQKLNTEMMSLLSSIFQRRYEPQFAWKSACSQFQALTGLRGFWPTSSFDESGDLYDLSGQGRTLTLNGNPVYGIDQLIPYVELDGTGDWFSAAHPGAGSWMDITGTETYVDTDYQGLTVGGWFRFGNAAGTEEWLISKWLVAGDERSYVLYRSAAGTLNFGVTSAGTAASLTSIGVAGPAQNEYFFGAARYSNVGNELKVWHNRATDTIAYNNTIFPGTADLVIGGGSGGLSLMTGRTSMCFLCAAALPDAVIGQLFQQSRAMFGV